MALTPLNDNIDCRAPKPLDSRYFNGAIPYTSTAQANGLTDPAYRHSGLTLYIVDREWWYFGGILDVHLVPKNNNDSQIILNADGPFTAPGNMLIAALVVTSNQNLAAFKAGTTAGGEDLIPPVSVAQNVPTPFGILIWRSSGQPIHFSGLAGATTTILIKTI